MHSSHSPSSVVNIESVRCGSPDRRTTVTAAATASLTEPVESAAMDGATEKATSMDPPYAAWPAGPRTAPAWEPVLPQPTATAAHDERSRKAGVTSTGRKP